MIPLMSIAIVTLGLGLTISLVMACVIQRKLRLLREQYEESDRNFDKANEKRSDLQFEIQDLKALCGIPRKFSAIPPNDTHPYRFAAKVDLPSWEERERLEVIEQWQRWHAHVNEWKKELEEANGHNYDGIPSHRKATDEALVHSFSARKAAAKTEFERYDKMAMKMEIPISVLLERDPPGIQDALK